MCSEYYDCKRSYAPVAVSGAVKEAANMCIKLTNIAPSGPVEESIRGAVNVPSPLSSYTTYRPLDLASRARAPHFSRGLNPYVDTRIREWKEKKI